MGDHVIFEDGARAWHPENIDIGENVYIGHGAMLKAYHLNRLVIGDNVWIGQNVFIHAAGGVTIGASVGIGPGVQILTSTHRLPSRSLPIIEAPLAFAPVQIQCDSDIGVGAILLPGVTIGQGAQVGAGAVVTRDVDPFAVVAGNPAKRLRYRAE